MILVTGGAGFIGSNLVDNLLASGYSVRVIDNLSSGNVVNLSNAQLYGDRFEFCLGDVRDFDDVVKVVKDISCVVHLAAQVSVQYSLQKPVVSASTNLMGFLNVLEAARINKVSRLIYASSAAVYGQPSRLPLSETSALVPISPYGLEKLVNEQYADLYGNVCGISCLGFRFFNVYGPRQDPGSSYAGVISKFIDRLAHDQPVTIFGDGLQTRDFVFVSDIANICTTAINSTARGVLCVGTGKSVNLLQLIQGLEGVVGKKAKVIHLPAVNGDIVQSSMAPENLFNALRINTKIDLEEGLRLLWDSL